MFCYKSKGFINRVFIIDASIGGVLLCEKSKIYSNIIIPAGDYKVTGVIKVDKDAKVIGTPRNHIIRHYIKFNTIG